MLEDETTDTTLFDFDEIADHLLEQGAERSPAEIHGCLSGLLSAGAAEEGEFGLDALTQVLDLAAHGELAHELMRLYTVTGEAMKDDEFSFNLLLPDDETALEHRVQALTEWCSGFLAGVAHAGSRRQNAWSSDAKEILEDIAAMSMAAITDEETEDESEGSYIEIVEYLRFAVLNLSVEVDAKATFSEITRDPNEPLH